MSVDRNTVRNSDEFEISAAAKKYLALPKQMLIGGEFVSAVSRATLDVLDPSTGRVISSIPNGTAEDVDRAVRAARAAFESREWSAIGPSARERLLLRLADLIDANSEELAELESIDNGKSVVMAKRVDVRGAVDFLRYIAGWATKIEGSTIDVSFPRPKQGGEYVAYTRKEPVGVVGAIIPWNYPLMMATWKIGPALAAGCTIVLKPAEETSLTALRLGELVMEAGFPAGVVNIVTGLGHVVGAALAAHPDVEKIAFTGSTEVGKLVGKAAMDRVARVSLELGGKSPVIVLADAAIETAAAGASAAIFSNHGQVCCAGSRLYVHRSIFDEVVSSVVARAEKLRVGAGLDPKTQLGPLVSARQAARVCGYINMGIEQGAKVATGGGKLDRPGFFVEPTVLVETGHQMAVVREEIFGPVLVAMPFDDIEEIVARANDGIYGLAASIWSNDLSKVHRLVPRLRAGTIWVNCHNLIDPALPFGGFKQSGIGREMGRAAVDLYTETKSVCMFV